MTGDRHSPFDAATRQEMPGASRAVAAGRVVLEFAAWALAATLLVQFGEMSSPDRQSAALFVLILFFGSIFVTGKARAAAAIALLLAGLIVVASRAKAGFLGAPLVFNDLIYLTGESLRVTALQYKGFAAAAAASVVAVLAAIGWLACCPGTRVSLLIRGLGLLIAGGLCFQLSDAAERSLVWDPTGDGSRGALSSFANSLTRWAVSGSDRVTFADVGGTPLAKAAANDEPKPGETVAGAANIVMVLEESVFDPRTFGLPAHNGVGAHFSPADGISGTLNVNVFGGATWVSEFSAVTGLDSRSFGEQAYYLPVLMEGRIHHSLMTLLKKRGYHTVVVYCMGGLFMNAEASYRSLGADVFDAAVKDDEPGVMWVRRDRDFYQRALDHIADIRRESGRPVFALVVTIYNHGPHGAEDFLEGRHHEVRSWLNRTASGRAMAPYRDYYLRLQDIMSDRRWLHDEIARRFPDDPFVVVRYGDHQPRFTQDLLGRAGIDDVRALYRTGFAIEGINRALAPVPGWGGGPLDIAYLPGLVLAAAGIEPDRIFAARLQLMHRCGGVYAECSEPLKGRIHRTLVEERLVEVDAILPERPNGSADTRPRDTRVEFAGRRP